jgi:hypothetical protein
MVGSFSPEEKSKLDGVEGKDCAASSSTQPIADGPPSEDIAHIAEGQSVGDEAPEEASKSHLPPDPVKCITNSSHEDAPGKPETSNSDGWGLDSSWSWDAAKPISASMPFPRDGDISSSL